MSEPTMQVLIRRMLPSDAPAVRYGFEHLSAASKRSRFFSPAPQLAPEQLDELVKVDPATRTVVLAFDPVSGWLAGGARAIRAADDPGAAELAVTVGDDWQHHGIGTRLLQALHTAARADGIDRLTGLVLVDNLAARTMLRNAGAVRALFEPGVLSFELPLAHHPVLAA